MIGFTTATVDNIDVNPSSTTARESFHGTEILLFQSPTKECLGRERQVLVIDSDTYSEKKVEALPAFYTNIDPVSLGKSSPTIPRVDTLEVPRLDLYDKEINEEKKWLEHVRSIMSKELCGNDDSLTWAASYHASTDSTVCKPMALNALLPLLSENAHSPAMIRHSMGLVQKAVKHLNPGQTPVVTFDQPLFTIAKEIQWKYPDSHGEDIFVIMFGGLHIEMAALKALGSWLDGSGWTKALAEAKVASPGTADSFISCDKNTTSTYSDCCSLV